MRKPTRILEQIGDLIALGQPITSTLLAALSGNDLHAADHGQSHCCSSADFSFMERLFGCEHTRDVELSNAPHANFETHLASGLAIIQGDLK